MCKPAWQSEPSSSSLSPPLPQSLVTGGLPGNSLRAEMSVPTLPCQAQRLPRLTSRGWEFWLPVRRGTGPLSWTPSSPLPQPCRAPPPRSSAPARSASGKQTPSATASSTVATAGMRLAAVRTSLPLQPPPILPRAAAGQVGRGTFEKGRDTEMSGEGGSPNRVLGSLSLMKRGAASHFPCDLRGSPAVPIISKIGWAQLHPKGAGGTLWQHVGGKRGGGRPWVRAAPSALVVAISDWKYGTQLGLPPAPIPADGGGREELLGWPTFPAAPALALSGRLRLGPRCSLQQDRGGQRCSARRVAMAGEPVAAAKAARVWGRCDR